MSEQKFDVFLAHSSKDKALIRKIYAKLKEEGFRPWLDEEEIAPGTRFQDELQQAIGEIKSAAIFIGKDGLGAWQGLELSVFINQCIKRNIKVIPVLLPDVEILPEKLIFLEEFHAVQFNKGIEDDRAFYHLIWGITGEKPKKSRKKTHSNKNQKDSLSTNAKKNEIDARCIDLNHYLEHQRWKEADIETNRLVLEKAGAGDSSDLKSTRLLTFPCGLLIEIDRLWLKHSNGRFGFSAQQEVYVDCGGLLDGESTIAHDVYIRFLKAIGKYKPIDNEFRHNGFVGSGFLGNVPTDNGAQWLGTKYKIESPKGHLPSGFSTKSSNNKCNPQKGLFFMMFRISECNLQKSGECHSHLQLPDGNSSFHLDHECD